MNHPIVLFAGPRPALIHLLLAVSTMHAVIPSSVDAHVNLKLDADQAHPAHHYVSGFLGL